MAVDSLTSISTTQVVHQKHDAERVGPDGHPRRDEGGRQGQREQAPDTQEPHPVSNEQGQTTGKVIDTTA